MKIKHIRYVVREKTTKEYMAEEGDIYSDGETCKEIEYAYFWLDDDDATEYINNCLDEPELFEVVRVDIQYSLANQNE